ERHCDVLRSPRAKSPDGRTTRGAGGHNAANPRTPTRPTATEENAASAACSDHQHLRADLGQVEQFLDVLAIKAKTAIRRLPADLSRIVGAVDPVVLPRKVERVVAQRIHRVPTRDLLGKRRIAL